MGLDSRAAFLYSGTVGPIKKAAVLVDVYRFPYLVGMVIPSLGRVKMAKLSEEDQRKAITKVLKAFEKWFGGAVPVKTPVGGIVRMASGTGLLDPDQILVLAGTHRKDFLRYERRIAALADEVGDARPRVHVHLGLPEVGQLLGLHGSAMSGEVGARHRMGRQMRIRVDSVSIDDDLSNVSNLGKGRLDIYGEREGFGAEQR